MKLLKYLEICLISCLLIILPACPGKVSPPLDPAQQYTVDQLQEVEDKALAEAAKYEEGSANYLANLQRAREAHDAISEIEAEASKGFISNVLDYLPIPEPFKAPVATIGASLIFRRPRELYLAQLKSLAQAAMHVSPIERKEEGGIQLSKVGVGDAVKELWNVVKSPLVITGLMDRHPKPDQPEPTPSIKIDSVDGP